VPPYLLISHAVALFDFKRDFLAVVVGFAGAKGNDETFGWFFLAVSGNDDAAFLDFLLFNRSTSTRSPSGLS